MVFHDETRSKAQACRRVWQRCTKQRGELYHKAVKSRHAHNACSRPFGLADLNNQGDFDTI
eukprot:4910448-Amphidinium_carterae.1